MLPNPTPATQTATATMATNGNQARHQSQPSAISATPATQSDGRCHQVPRLPRKVKVDVTKCHACHGVVKLCGDKLCVSKLCVVKLCVSKLCVSKLYMNKLCVSKLYVDKLCVSELYVCVWTICTDVKLLSGTSVLFVMVHEFLISFSCRGMECASDVSIQRRRICCTVIWIGDAQSTYLLNLFSFSSMATGQA